MTLKEVLIAALVPLFLFEAGVVIAALFANADIIEFSKFAWTETGFGILVPVISLAILGLWLRFQIQHARKKARF